MNKISIIVPVYNNESYLSECLCSVCSSDRDFEIILIDDGSTDNSAIICDEYAKKDKRIKVFHKQNGGVSSARNYGIERATGEYIMFVDSDDILAEKWSKIFDYLNGGDIYYFDERIDIKVSIDNMLRYITGTNEERLYLSAPYSKVFKKSFIEKYNLRFDERIINGEDMLFNVDAILHAKTFEIINFQFYLYRQEVGQTTRRFDSRIIESDREFHKKLDKKFIELNVDSKIANDIEEFSLANAAVLILNRLSYAKKYSEVKKHYKELETKPYNIIISGKSKWQNHSRVLFYLCKMRQYRILYWLLKMRNKISMIIRQIKNEKFVKI